PVLYVRGHRGDFDAWEALGNPGWGLAAVLPAFKRAEHQGRGPSAYHGIGGPLHVTDPRWLSPLARAFVQAGVELGLARNDDFNGPEQDGVGFYQVTQRRGERHSAAAAYLGRPRPNLAVLPEARATRLLFDRRRALGVEYVRHGTTERVEARREVILAAGAVGSPHLL